jgi:hypothetical protein
MTLRDLPMWKSDSHGSDNSGMCPIIRPRRWTPRSGFATTGRRRIDAESPVEPERIHPPQTRRTIARSFRWLAVLLSALVASGCGVMRETLRMPTQAVTSVLPGGKTPKLDPTVLQADLQRYSDEFVSQTTTVLDEFAVRMGTDTARRQALRWKVMLGSTAVGIASGPNPRANLIDFVVLATGTRTSLEEFWTRGADGAAFQPWLKACQALETNAWALCQGLLTAPQEAELRQALRQWWEANPEGRSNFLVRPEEFGRVIRQAHQREPRSGSVFALVGLDPIASLDPAVQEVTRARLFAERALFTAQRAPFLLRWQIELLADQLTRGPEVQTVVETSDRLGRAAETATSTMAQLPDRLTEERKAILAALEEQEGRLRELSLEVGRTLAAGGTMSESLNKTLVTFDALMKRFGVGEPETAPAPAEPGEPFRIQDYGDTAQRLEAAARQLTELLHTLDQTLGSTNLSQLTAQVGPVVTDAQSRGQALVDYAFWRGLILVGAVFLAALVYRLLATRMGRVGAS